MHSISRSSIVDLEQDRLSSSTLPSAQRGLGLLVRRYEAWLALAVVAAGAWASWSASNWLLSGWQIQ
jgi:hypothetical protein